MRLDDARLCLDCEEIHQEQECPACGSEAFGFLTRWIHSTSPAQEAPWPPTRPTRSPPGSRDPGRVAGDHRRHGADDSGRGKKIVTRSLLGLAAMGLAGWAWAKTSPSKDDDS